MREHLYEPIQGLPDKLPEGERVLWQGSPDWKALAVNAMHVRAIAIYFAILAIWRLIETNHDGVPLLEAAWLVGLLVGLGVAAIALLAGYAWLVQQTTIYTITDRRVVMRFGVALPMTINLPFAKVDAAAFRQHRRDIGDITLALRDDKRPLYFVMWPHVRPWRIFTPEPMIRCVADGHHAAELLSAALAQYVGQAETSVDAPLPAAPVVKNATVRLASAVR